MKATTARNLAPQVGTGVDRWRLLGGERFYTLARWLTVALLAAVTSLLTGAPLWPLTAESAPLLIVLWAYAGFSLFTTLALFLPAAGHLLGLAYIVDLLFIALMTFFGGEQVVVFFPLYLIPLINAALRHSRVICLFSGLFAALLYVFAFLGWRLVIAADSALPINTLDSMALGLRALTLVFVPLLTSGLAERWSENNRASVVQARQQAEQALAEARAYRDQMRSLYEVAYTLSTTVDYRQVLETTLRESRKLVPFSTGFVLLASGQPDELYVAASQSLAPADQSRRITVSSGLFAALRSSEARIVPDVSREPDLQSFETLRACAHACLIPLRAGMRTYGLLVVASEAPEPFTGEQVANLTALANYAIMALHNAQLIFDLKEERNKLISKEEQVRHQLARDLHDGPAQALAAITMNVEFIKRLLERDPDRVVEELDKLSSLAKRTTYEVRTMLFELRPLVLESQGLRATLEQYLERFKSGAKEPRILLEAGDLNDVRLGSKAEGTLFNIIQEAINNALKHAHAAHIWVRLSREGDHLVTVVQDDGAGFDMQSVLRSYEKRGSFGLLNIDERARLVGGHAEIASTPGNGTTVKVIVPIES
ncbi:MAG: GAF domain-containing sensor histidine kinase [Chloroflexaceae bacterium]